MKKILTSIFLLILLTSFQAYANWNLYEITNITETRIGNFNKGTVLEMKSGAVYQLHDRVQFSVSEGISDAVVLRDGSNFKIIFGGFDEPLVGVQLIEPDQKE